jgi:hypothetical protein
VWWVNFHSSSAGSLELQFVQRPQRFRTGVCSVTVWTRSNGCQLGENHTYQVLKHLIIIIIIIYLLQLVCNRWQ